MKEIKSFTLSPDVVVVLEQIPRLERSRTVNEILRQYLAGWHEGKIVQYGVEIDQVRSIVLQVLAGHQGADAAVDADEKEKARASDALAAILGMRGELET